MIFQEKEMAIINPNEGEESDQAQVCSVEKPQDSKVVIIMAMIAIAVFIAWVCYDIFF